MAFEYHDKNGKKYSIWSLLPIEGGNVAIRIEDPMKLVTDETIILPVFLLKVGISIFDAWKEKEGDIIKKEE